MAPDAAMRGLGKAAFHAAAALATHFGKPSPGLSQDEDLTRANGAELLNDFAGDMFPQLRGSSAHVALSLERSRGFPMTRLVYLGFGRRAPQGSRAGRGRQPRDR
jgi:hypothetical protein